MNRLLPLLLFGLVALLASTSRPREAVAQSDSAGTGDAATPEGASTQFDIGEIILQLNPHGVRTLTPMAVPDTLNLGTDDPDGLRDRITLTMRRCFQIAGYFDVYGPDRYFFDASREGIAPSQINFPNWYNVGAQALIKTGFRVATNQAALDFRLYSVDTGTEIDVGWQPITVSVDDVMPQVYDFVNRVIEYYTGQRGIFGTQITFAGPGRNGQRQILVMSMDGLTMGSVTSNSSLNMLPSWGPGGQVMYTSYVNGNPDLYLGNNNARVLSDRPGLNSGGALSPDGSEIAVTLSRGEDTEIYILDTQGSILRQCTDNTAEDVSATWSPDGSQIAFNSDQSGGPQIYVMNRDCSGQRRVTFAGSYNTTPDWSPRGDRIAFTGRDSHNRFDIFTVEPATGYIERLTQDQGNNEEPSWSPDGRYLVFSSTRGGGGPRLYIMTDDGQYQFEVTTDGSGFVTPAWQR